MIAALPPEQWDEQVTYTAARIGEDQPIQMVDTEVIAAAINYDFATEHQHRPAEHGAAAVKLADLAAQLEQRQASLATREARAEAFNTVLDAVRAPAADTGADAAAHEAARRAEQHRREEQRRRDPRRDGPTTTHGPSLR